MNWAIAGILLIVGFGTLIIAFASASKLAGRIRPYIGIGLILALIITAMLDFTVWAIAESIVTVIFFSFYPNDQISGHGVIAPVAVLIGCLGSILLLAALPIIGIGIIMGIVVEKGIAILFRNTWQELTLLFILIFVVFPFSIFTAITGIKHLWPKMRLAIRVLGRNV